MSTSITVDTPLVVPQKAAATFDSMKADTIHITFDDAGNPTISLRFVFGRWDAGKFICFRDANGVKRQKDFTLTPDIVGAKLLKLAGDMVDAIASDHAAKVK